MQVGTVEKTKFPPYKRMKGTFQQVIYKTYLGKVGGKARWSSETKHEKI